VGKRQILNCDDVLKAMRGGAAIFSVNVYASK
jgi:hypothetical protein